MIRRLWRSRSPSYSLPQSKALLERILTQNIMPFWDSQILDQAAGGYQLNHDWQGRWLGASDKALVTQARVVWFFAHLCQTPYGTAHHREIAQHGYTFLRDCLWDQALSGFYWAVDASGQKVRVPHKHLYGQAFALYALSEYAMATGDVSAAQLADRLFDCLEAFAHDAEFGGYRECFARDWQALPSDEIGQLGVASQFKLMNTHLHLLEALTVYARLSQRAIAHQRLTELILILSNTVMRKPLGACTEQHHANWVPCLEAMHQRVSYGHDLEVIWLLGEACQQAQIPHFVLLDGYRTLFGYAWRYGFDHRQGGFYESGRFNAFADRRKKIWWVQAETLVAALYLYQLTQEKLYWDCFSQILHWIVEHQVDWQHGDWHAEVLPNGKSQGHKASAWKAPYHNGRAMMLGLALLQRLASTDI